ncbi:MutS-related protein [Clostridium akagii]|uniref:lysine 5,6-aminomutase reactivase ATPase KamC n=1 Tax=Clostridium akagii TaxID=91623 RepID=UPI00047C3194|nr:hypothetical protein [Clostridium akagii]
MIDLDKKSLEKIGFFNVLDSMCISTVFGHSLIYNLKQITDINTLSTEYDNVEKCITKVRNDKFYNNFTDLLGRFRDIRNTFTKCSLGEVLDEVELYEIKNFTLLSMELKQIYENSNLLLTGITLFDLSAVYKKLNPHKSETNSFYIYNDYSQFLIKVRIKKASIDKLLFKEKDLNKQKELLRERASMINEEKSEEFKIRKMLSSEILKYTEKLLDFTSNIGKLDILFSKAKLAIDYDMCRPIARSKNTIRMKNGVHPIIKNEVTKRGGIFYPISIEVSLGSSVITGANMGGKTVILSVIALNCILASLGFFSFAETFEFFPFDFIYFLYEDSVSPQTGLSSFGSEIVQVKKALEKLKYENGILLIDEFARGTNPVEGSNLTKALVSYLNKFSSVSVLTTHYDGVCTLAKKHYQVKGLKNIDFTALKISYTSDENYLKIINNLMDYTLEKMDKNAVVPRDALNICSLIGIDSEIIKIAEKMYTGRQKNEKQTES